MNKEAMINTLPVTHDDLIIRYWEREDLDMLAHWSSCPFPYEKYSGAEIFMDGEKKEWMT